MARAWVDATQELLDDERAQNLAADYMMSAEFKADIAEARSSLKRPFTARLEDHLEQLAILRDQAAAGGKYSAAVSAEIARGKAQRFYDPPKSEDDPLAVGDAKKLGDDELRKQATEIIRRRKLQHANVDLKDVEGTLSGRPPRDE